MNKFHTFIKTYGFYYETSLTMWESRFCWHGNSIRNSYGTVLVSKLNIEIQKKRSKAWINFTLSPCHVQSLSLLMTFDSKTWANEIYIKSLRFSNIFVLISWLFVLSMTSDGSLEFEELFSGFELKLRLNVECQFKLHSRLPSRIFPPQHGPMSALCFSVLAISKSLSPLSPAFCVWFIFSIKFSLVFEMVQAEQFSQGTWNSIAKNRISSPKCKKKTAKIN
jgi:hypothetical protein